MNELAKNPISRAHSSMRQASTMAERGFFLEAIEIYKQANGMALSPCCEFVCKTESFFPQTLLRRYWKVRVMTLY